MWKWFTGNDESISLWPKFPDATVSQCHIWYQDKSQYKEWHLEWVSLMASTHCLHPDHWTLYSQQHSQSETPSTVRSDARDPTDSTTANVHTNRPQALGAMVSLVRYGKRQAIPKIMVQESAELVLTTMLAQTGGWRNWFVSFCANRVGNYYVCLRNTHVNGKIVIFRELYAKCESDWKWEWNQHWRIYADHIDDKIA